LKAGFTDLLRCPSCGGALRCVVGDREGERIVSGSLWCDACGREFPIVAGIPRFVPAENYARSFGEQWKRFRTAQIDRFNGTTLSERRLLSETGLPAEWWKGKRVLDVGCGAGRFVEVASRLGAHVVGLDYSDAVDAAALNVAGDPSVELVQADVYAMPFAPGTFEAVYCIGVVQHTPDPLRAVAALAVPARPDAHIAVTAYERRRTTPLYSKYLARAVLRPLGTEGKLSLVRRLMPVLFPLTDVLFRIPLLGRVFRFAIPVANYVDLKELSRSQRYEWALLDTLDMLGPAYDQPQRESEVTAALRNAGVVDVRRLPSVGLNMVGRRAPVGA